MIMIKRHPIAAVLAVLLLVLVGIPAAKAALDGPTASCTPAPVVEDTEAGSKITVECTVPKPAPVTETVTTPGPTVTATATVTTTATVTASPTQAPSSATPTSTPTTSSPTPTATTSAPPASTFPDASTTGVPAGTTLTAYTGPSNITTANTVISGKTIGCIKVSAPGVIIRKSRLSCKSPVPYVVTVDDRGGPSSAPLLLEDVEVNCQDGGGTAIGEAWVTLRRVNINGCENGIDANQGITVEDSFIHDLWNSAESHTDGIQFAGHWNGTAYVDGALNITIRHTTIFDVSPDGTTLGTSAIIAYPQADRNILIQDNLLGGGAYTLYCDRPGVGTNFQVIGNHFTGRFSPKVGAFGPSDDCADEQLSGNVWHEAGIYNSVPHAAGDPITLN